MERTFLCAHCGGRYRMPLLFPYEAPELCRPCGEELTVPCSDCGTRIWRTENAGDADTPLCIQCHERHFTNCVQCRSLIRLSDALYENSDADELYPFCPNCYSRRDEGIREYSYKPSPIFYGEGKRFFGVELEIDCGGELDQHARMLKQLGNAGGCERIYCKHDGSLEEGIEIVSHPMTLSYHMDEMPWCNVISKARELHYSSHQAGTCGLHVHVSRTAFGDTEAEQDICIARILFFFEKNWEELLKFSRRTPSQLASWAARYGYKTEPWEILDTAKRRYSRSRYTCVNLTNADTIEFRMFRGTLKLNTFLATLQLVDRICDIAMNLTDDEVKGLAWTSFAAGCERPELVQYLKERRLYVNEPEEAEEEV